MDNEIKTQNLALTLNNKNCQHLQKILPFTSNLFNLNESISKTLMGKFGVIHKAVSYCTIAGIGHPQPADIVKVYSDLPLDSTLSLQILLRVFRLLTVKFRQSCSSYFFFLFDNRTSYILYDMDVDMLYSIFNGRRQVSLA